MNFITKRIRQIFFMSQLQKRIIAAVLTVCMILGMMQFPGIVYDIKAADENVDENINLSDYNIWLIRKDENNKEIQVPIEKGTELKEGDEIYIGFTWVLDDDENNAKTFVASITPLTNIVLVDYPVSPLKLDGYGEVGTYEIKDNQFIVTLNEENVDFLNATQREGWAHIQGVIDVDDENAKDGDVLEYGVGDENNGFFGEFTYVEDVVNGTLSLQKSASGKVTGTYPDYEQTYTIKIAAQNGAVTIGELRDSHGTGLEGPDGAIKVVDSTPGAGFEGKEYSDFSELTGVVLEKDQYIELEYTMDVDPSVYAQSSEKTFYNYAEATYDNGTGEEQKTSASYANVSVNRPQIQKSGTYNADDQSVQWTITVRLNDLTPTVAGYDLATILSNVTDTPGTGLVPGNLPTVADFVDKGNGVWECTYTTQLEEAYKDYAYPVYVNNNVSVDINGNTYSTSGQVQKPGDSDILQKEAVGNADEDGVLTWNVTIDTSKLPDNVDYFAVYDRPRDSYDTSTGQQAKMVDTIVVDGVTVANGDGVSWTQVSGEAVSSILDEAPVENYETTVKLSGEYVQRKKDAGESIVVTFRSKILDESTADKNYINDVRASYVGSNGTEMWLDKVSATWVDPDVERNAIEKTGVAVDDDNEIEYTVKVKTTDMGTLVAGQDIVLEDILPENMVFVDGSFSIEDYGYKTQYYSVPGASYIHAAAGSSPSTGKAAVSDLADGTQKLTITIPVTEDMIKLSEYYETVESAKHYLLLKYRTKVKDVRAFMQEGLPKEFENKIEGTYNGDSIGSDSTKTILTPQNMINKTGTYSKQTAPDIEYEVEVNPQALDLSDTTLQAVDKLGPALSYNMSSIEVYKNVSGTWELMTGGYSYTRNMAENSITFTLPDSMYLKIKYTATVTLSLGEQLTEENAFNSFALSGFQGSVGEGETATVSAVVTPDVGVSATKTNITIWKYWGEYVNAQPLDGCTFAVYETQEISAGVYEVTGDPIQEGITVNEDGEAVIRNLTKDAVYALVETAAKAGYELNTEPYYFIVLSDDDNRVNYESTNVNVYSGTGVKVPFANQPSGSEGSIELSKTVTGDRNFEQIKADISFVLTNPDNTTRVITGSELTAAGNKLLITGLEPGTYTIKETGATTGYVCTTTSQVGSAAIENTAETTFQVAEQATTTVNFTNDYQQIKGSLTLKKTVESGDPLGNPPQYSAVQEKISFLVSGPDGYSIEIDGTALDETNGYTISGLAPGEYTVLEKTEAVAGYSRYETKHTVKVGGGAASSSVESVAAGNISVNADETTEVCYTNIYYKDKGTIRLEKTTTGLLFSQVAGDLEFEISGPNGYSLTITGDKLVGDGNSYDIGGLEPGEYVIKEISKGVPSSYIFVTASYTAGGVTTSPQAPAVDGTNQVVQTGDVSVTTDGITKVTFYNNYEPAKGGLKITKTVTGATLDMVKDSMSFKLTGDGVNEIISGSRLASDGSYTFSDLAPGKYTLEEIVGVVQGYALESTQITLGGEVKTGQVTTLEIKSEETTEVAINNIYQKGKASIRLKKTTSGASYANVKDYIVFEIYRIEGSTETKVQEVKGSALSGADNTTVIGGLEPGTYKVVESITAGGDYGKKTTYYRLDGGASQSGTETSGVTLVSGDLKEVEFINEYEKLLGSLSLTKRISGISDSADVEKAYQSMHFTVIGKNCYRTITGEELYNAPGYTVTIDNLEAGSSYIVTETTTDISGYGLLRTDYTISNSVTADEKKSGKQATVTMIGNETTGLTFDNIYAKKGSLKLTKSVAGVDFDDVKSGLEFEITYPDGRTTVTVKGEELDADGSYVLQDLPSGPYTIKETKTGSVNGYTYQSTVVGTVSGTETKVTVSSGNCAEVSFANEYTRDEGALYITKTIKGEVTKEEAEGALVFTVTDTATKKSETYKLSRFKYDPTSPEGEKRYMLELSLPTGTYEVEETIYDVKGYVTASVKYSVDRADMAEGTKASAKVKKENVVNVAFEDVYTPESKSGKMIITKTIKGDVTKEEAEGALTFTVTDTADKKSVTYKLSQFIYDTSSPAGEKKYTLELPLPVGTYEVEETICDIDGYVLSSVKYSVDGSSYTDGKKTTAEVKKGDVVNVAYEDVYTSEDTDEPKDETGTLVIKKTIKGDVTKEEAEGALRFKVTNKDDKTSETYTLKDFKKGKDGVYRLELEVTAGGYIVEETIYDIDGYVTASVKYAVDGGEKQSGSEAEVTVEKKQTVTVEFEDVYEEKQEEVKEETAVATLVLTKTVKGDLIWDDIKDDLKFVVKNEQTGESKTYKAADFKDADKDGVYTLTLKKLEKGKYTVTEKIGDVKGYELKTAYTVNGADAVSGKEVTVKLGKKAVKLEFVNTYTSTKGKLVITKKLKGNIDRSAAESVLEFVVTNTETKKSKTYTLDDFTYDKETKKYTLELSKEPGTYKVEETAYDVEGYKIASITYTVGSGEKQKGTSAKVKVKTGKTTKIAFVDTYYETDTSSGQTTPGTPSSTTTTSTTNRTTPKTGDEAPIALWIAMLLLGACGIGGSIYGMRRNKK